MSFFKEELKNIKAFVFDVDGVLSKDTSPLNEEGDPVRTANVKDGFAIRNALAMGYPVAVITGGFVERVRLRHERLGVKYYYDKVRDKSKCLNDFLEKTGIKPENVLFMGDDLVDYKVMLEVGVPVCPQDAVSDIKAISKYVSPRKGGEGCVRDVIEQTLRAQEKWIPKDMSVNNAY
ncbi:3-deoxy-D-manno-octulosonate 8-phosphate phosphatase [Mariniphaga sediminis]|jgi:3-deoxy-D-manno-octulosonate 8-phosphate phosphatase (KDO 8-P phosphatase)|uniref:3-deoxy-D-manno-octulosonate 8-phosphate phosphatase n=1 Tax=Mariniphaga sediminis TaxID=1628158 RepID=A0A399CYW7_9BACT|nr:HAD family hydrolase [Mariniphaga sediminis]RIH63591.1 3-deoxy-D-manno-octulosonate 8-phosphate phosphatase [Mariniphaga sediminis]